MPADSPVMRPALVIDGALRVPAGLDSPEALERWRQCADFPAGVRVEWRDGAVWIETPAGKDRSGLRSPWPRMPCPRSGAAVVIDGDFWVPIWVVDLESFRRWTLSEECPERGVRLCFLNGGLWIDRTMEQLYTHNQVRGAVDRILGPLVFNSQRGRWMSDGMRLSNVRAGQGVEPDGMFVSYAALQSGQVRRIPGRVSGVVELEGSPEMVLEVVSDSSIQKDTVELPVAYHQSAISEFWRVDARGPEVIFEILSWAQAGYVPTLLADGWWRSPVFGHDFRLTRQTDPLGEPLFVLEMR